MKRLTSAFLALLLALSFTTPVLSVSGSEHFADIPEDAWYAEYIDICYESGLLNGVGDGRFDPDGTVTLGQALMVCARIHNVLTGGDGKIPELPAAGVDGLVYFTDTEGNRVATYDDVKSIGYRGDDVQVWFSSEATERLRDEDNPLDTVILVSLVDGEKRFTAEYYDTEWGFSMYIVTVPKDQDVGVGLVAELEYLDWGYENLYGHWADSAFYYLDRMFYDMSYNKQDQYYDLSDAMSDEYPELDNLAESEAYFDEVCPRAGLAAFLFLAIPDEHMTAINNVGILPELDCDALRTLYNAGIIGGVDDKGTLDGMGTLTRAQLAAIAARVIEPELRLTLSLDLPQPLTIYNWGEYIDPETLEIFEKETGVKVIYRMYSNPEELYSILKSGKQADVIITQDYMLDRLRREGMLEKLSSPEAVPNNDNRIPGLETLAYDPTDEYTVPYLWGVMGFAHTGGEAGGFVGWDSLFRPTHDKVMMVSFIQESMAMALKSLGYSINTADKRELEAAFNLLMAQRDRVAKYADYGYIMDSLISDGMGIAPLYNVDAYYTCKEREDLRFSFPEGGSVMFVDAAAMLESSQNKEAAELFLHFLCRTDIAALNAEYVDYLTPFAAVREMYSYQFSGNEWMYPTADYLAKCELFLDLPEDIWALYDEFDARLKAG